MVRIRPSKSHVGTNMFSTGQRASLCGCGLAGEVFSSELSESLSSAPFFLALFLALLPDLESFVGVEAGDSLALRAFAFASPPTLAAPAENETFCIIACIFVTVGSRCAMRGREGRD